MSEIRNIPRLRFPEFHEEWIQNSLGDISSFSKGKGISKSDIIDNGLHECIRYGELYTHYNEVIDKVISKTDFNENPVLSEINDVIIPSSGETSLDIATASCVLKKDVLLGGDLNIIKSKVNGVFLSYYLNNKRKKEIARLSQGNSVVHVYPSQLKILKIFIPQTDEYDKIADFLTEIDKRIDLLEKKKTLLETYKKGVMKKIFNQEIRFKDENGNDFPDWDEKRLGELSPKMKSGGTPKSTIKDYYDGDIPFLSIGDMTSQNKYLNWTSKTISKRGLENSSSWVVPKNSIIYSMYASVGFVSINKIDLSISQAVMAIQPIDEMNLEFLYYSLLNFQPKIKSLIETGTQGNINGGIVKNISIETPSFNEQQKISQFLSSIDNQIELLETQIDKSKTWKKGLLQKMFV